MTVATELAPQPWIEANQRYLVAAMDRVRASIEELVGRGAAGLVDVSTLEAGDRAPAAAQASADGPQTAADEAMVAAELAMASPPSLASVSSAFGLSTFEREILVLAAAVELDGSFAGLCATAQGDPSAGQPTFGLALAALPDPHWSAIAPARPLRRWHLLDVAPGRPLTATSLRIEERVLHHLVGVEGIDERLDGIVEPLPPPSGIPPSHLEVARRVVGLWSAQFARHEPAVGLSAIQLCGPDALALRAIAGMACYEVGLHPFLLRAESIPAAPQDQSALGRLWERDAILGGWVLVVDRHGTDRGEGTDASVARFVGSTNQPAIILTRDPLRTVERPSVRMDVERPPGREQRDQWRAVLGLEASALREGLDRIVGQFDLGSDQIRSAGEQLLMSHAGVPAEEIEEAVWDACRRVARPGLDDLAQRIEPAATWEELVLPEAQRRTLHGMVTHTRHRTKVYETWGFAERGRRGLGVSALFAGASGTGKTMAAEVLADELRLDLYRIDLSSVVSKYIGETEKNLRRVFDAAEEGGAILLFDEADALFGKRSDVRDSHDRYANIEVSYLLQRMEAYRGLAILTTNLKAALDPAFLRRIRFVVQFPFPDPAQRAEIWRRIFPSHTPTEGLDVTTLARLNVSGGSIRDIALQAAFLAADAAEPVRMGHLLRAARGEYEKLEKPLTHPEIGGWS
jgi:ATPase family associated with various cellular activities (AAA)/Winged helix domain, variant